MTNKTNNYWEEIENEFDEKFSQDPCICKEGFRDFIRKTLLSTINKIGLEEPLGLEKIEKAKPEDLTEIQERNYWNMRGISYGRSLAKAEIDEQKQDLIKSINKD